MPGTKAHDLLRDAQKRLAAEEGEDDEDCNPPRRGKLRFVDQSDSEEGDGPLDNEQDGYRKGLENDMAEPHNNDDVGVDYNRGSDHDGDYDGGDNSDDGEYNGGNGNNSDDGDYNGSNGNNSDDGDYNGGNWNNSDDADNNGGNWDDEDNDGGESYVGDIFNDQHRGRGALRKSGSTFQSLLRTI